MNLNVCHMYSISYSYTHLYLNLISLRAIFLTSYVWFLYKLESQHEALSNLTRHRQIFWPIQRVCDRQASALAQETDAKALAIACHSLVDKGLFG